MFYKRNKTYFHECLLTNYSINFCRKKIFEQNLKTEFVTRFCHSPYDQAKEIILRAGLR